MEIHHAFCDGSVLRAVIPIGQNNAFIYDSVGDARRRALPRRDLARETRNMQRLDRHRNDDGQEQHRGQHLGQREGGAFFNFGGR
jgi:hypothetical protein